MNNNNNNNITTTTTTFAGINTTMKKKKTSQGRKKIEIKKIQQLNTRQVTFSKRRVGLFKKASELCILTGAHIAILVNSPGGRFFAFGHPNSDVIIDRYLNNNNNSNNNNNNNNNNINSNSNNNSNSNALMPECSTSTFNQHYMEVSKELEAEKRRREMIREAKVLKGGGLLWYEEEVDGMEVEELEEYFSSLVELKRKVLVRADELLMIKKTPIFLGQNMLAGDVVGYEVGNTMLMPDSVTPLAPGFGYGWI